jgi:hypothetical protein
LAMLGIQSIAMGSRFSADRAADVLQCKLGRNDRDENRGSHPRHVDFFSNSTRSIMRRRALRTRPVRTVAAPPHMAVKIACRW